MFNLRATAKLLRRLKGAAADPASATTRLGDWYGNLLSVGRQQFAMFTSELSLLTVIMPAKEIQPLPDILATRLRGLLADLKFPPTQIDDEVQKMQACAITATANRSVLGSMNDFVFSAKIHLSESPPRTLGQLQLLLAQTPMKALEYRFPCEVVLELLQRHEQP